MWCVTLHCLHPISTCLNTVHIFSQMSQHGYRCGLKNALFFRAGSESLLHRMLQGQLLRIKYIYYTSQNIHQGAHGLKCQTDSHVKECSLSCGCN